MEIYDLVVIGAGSAGLSAVGFASELDARVALVEKRRIGGDCTWTGCVPSKTLIKAARVTHQMRTANRYGLAPVEPTVDLASVMDHVRQVIETIYEEEKPEVLRAKGIDVYLGTSRFRDARTLIVGEQMLEARNVVLAVGAYPWSPPIDGLDGVDYVTNETIWQMATLPRHLMVVGGGPIGSEMSQAFRRLGSRVTVMEASEGLLPHDEPEASRLLAQVFDEEGITVLTNCHVERVWQEDAGGDIHVTACDEEIVGDALLVATGRRPNVAGLALDKAGVDYDGKGIVVDDKLRTSQRGIYAAGDCLGSYLFTHYAGRQGLTAARNALLPGASRGTRAWVPWTTFTQPEVAHAGLTERQAREREGESVETLMWSLDEIDRAHTEGDTQGFIKLVMRENGPLLGVTVVADRAGELIHAWMYVLEDTLKLRDLVNTMHVYPTYSLANVKAAGALLERRTLGGRFGPIIRWLGRLALKVMRWRRDL